MSCGRDRGTKGTLGPYNTELRTFGYNSQHESFIARRLSRPSATLKDDHAMQSSRKQKGARIITSLYDDEDYENSGDTFTVKTPTQNTKGMHPDQYIEIRS